MKIKVPTEEITDNFYTIIDESDVTICIPIKGDATEESSDEVDTTADKSDVNESDGVNEKTEVKYINSRQKLFKENLILHSNGNYGIYVVGSILIFGERKKVCV